MTAVACALAAPAYRVFSLEGSTPEGVLHFISPIKNLSLDGDKPQTWETLTRTGTFYDPRYGKFEITREMLLQMVSNFEKGTYGQKIFIDVSHEPSKGAAAEILKLTVEGTKLRALLEWTPYGIDAVVNKKQSYFSVEFADNFVDNEKREQHGATLLGAGLTIRPVVKHLDPVDSSRFQLAVPDGAPPTLLTEELHTQLLSEIQTMWKELIKSLTEKLKGFKLADAIVEQVVKAADAALGKVTDETAAKALCAAFEASGKQLSEAIAAGQTGDLKIQLSVPDSFKIGMSPDEVEKLVKQLADDQAKAAKTLSETRDSRVKLLTDTIGAAQGLDDDLKKELTESVADLVTADMTEDQVKRLAAVQIDAGNRLVAARQLAGLGYQVKGSTIISVDSSNEIKALQEEVDKRLKLDKQPLARRYALSEGVKLEANKELVDQVLAMYDAEHGRRLHDEYRRWKKLAAGDSLVSDVAVPASFERTVTREALYQLVGLGLCDVGTAQYAAVVQLPYSYRDTAAAGRSNTRVYEGGAIRRAGVKQALEEARPIPQKIAFEVSDELRYLAGNGQINFDIVAENARNAVRIIGEDTEKLIFDEHLNAADQYAVTAVTDEATATGDGTKKTFVLDNFPVVRPKKVYDLQGNQVGNTLYPVVVKSNSVTRSEYDGTGTQGAGVYYTIDYNLGEVTFVNELGVPTAPTNGHAIVCSYSYTTNVYKFDIDLGALKTDEKYDDFLYRFGLRKALIEDRAYMANLGIMSGTLRTQIEQARQFGANFKRAGTDLMADGNLGRIKDVPSFRSYAPGLNAGDQRVVICERASTRFRMLKPWTMNELENQKNSDGRFTGKKEAYGDQFIVVHTPTQLKGAFTSMVVYSAGARIDR
jgi:hypothetical protein